MPATRAQRQRVQQRRHTNLPDEIVRHIVDIAGPYCVLVKGGQACSLQIPRTAGRTAKSYLAPVSNNLLRVPDDHASIAEAVAAAQNGQTILVDDDVYELDRVITVPPIRLQIVGNTKGLCYGTRRTPHGEFERFPHNDSPFICGSFNERDGGDEEEDGGVFFVEGAGAQLTLRNIVFRGVSDDWEEVEDELAPIELDGHDTGIVATQGARVTIENCWFSNFGRTGFKANTGARIEATDCTFNRHYFGALSSGPRTSVVLRNVDFQGANVYAAIADDGGRIDLKACRIRGARLAGMIAKDAGSRIRFDALTQYVSQKRHPANQPRPWVKRACVIENGSLTFPDKIPGVWQVEGNSWAWLCEDRYPDDKWASDVEWESDDEDDDDETRWLTIRDDGWESGHERCMNPSQEGWLPGPLPPPQHD